MKYLYLSLKNDLPNIVKYGWKAPRYAELIFVDPTNIEMYISTDLINKTFNNNKRIKQRKYSGYVTNNKELFNNAQSIFELPKIRFCYQHWDQGLPWKDTERDKYYRENFNVGIFPDKIFDFSQVENRYHNLDQIFNEVKKSGYLKTKKEINPNNYRESGGVFVHIGPKGNIYFSGGGQHRFSIARILGIKMPAQIGIVHKDAIKYLNDMRK